MKAIVLVKKGKPEEAFEIQEREKPVPGKNQVLLKVEGFGLNYAEIFARWGMYKDAPPMPSILGYDVVGRIAGLGESTTGLQIGQRVVAFTHFGGYAEYAIADDIALAPISDEMPTGAAVALVTQYCTAHYCIEELAPLYEGSHVLIHAAAGGVGIAMVQLAKRKGAVIYGTASPQKLELLKELGVDYPIDYKNQDFKSVIQNIQRQNGHKGLDVIYDSIGGKSVKKGYQLLGIGGRIVCFGGAVLTQSHGRILQLLRTVLGFGFYSPIGMMRNSKAMIGVNMLHTVENKPQLFQNYLYHLIELYNNKEITPIVGAEFHASQIAEAHRFFESRQSIGKIVLNW